MKIINLLIIISLCNIITAQTYFSEIYAKQGIHSAGNNILVYNDHIYFTWLHRCLPDAMECGSVVKLTLEGDSLWSREINWIDFGNSNSMHIYNDTITVTGHINGNENTSSYKLMYLDVEGDSIAGFRHELSDTFGVMLNYGTTRINNKWLLYGGIRESNNEINGSFMKVNIDGSLDTLIFRDAGTQAYNVYDVQVNSNEEVVYVAQHYVNSLVGENRVITIVEEDGTIKEIYKSPPHQASVGDNLIARANGGYVITNQDPIIGGFSPEPVLSFVSKEGMLEKNTRLFLDELHRSDVYQIIEASNGDIIGSGQYTREKDENIFVRSGLLFRVSGDGELLWLKTYPKYDWGRNYYNDSYLLDLTEMPDGSILGTGAIIQHPDDGFFTQAWLLKTSPDGCLHNTDCGFEEFTTATKNNLILKETPIFPNPTSSILNIPSGTSIMNIFSQTGQLIINQKEFNNRVVNVSSLEDGIYYLYLYGEKGEFRIERFVKI